METDYLIKALSEDGYVSLTAVSSRVLTQRAADIHKASRTAAAALGRTMAGALMLASTLKNELADITVRISGGGPIGTIVAVAEAEGTVRCSATHPEADTFRRADGKLNVGALVGTRGMLSVVRDEGFGEPYSGGTELVTGEIAEDFAQYLTVSEQQPSAVALGVLVNRGSEKRDYIAAAGGYIVSLLPGLSIEASEQYIEAIELNIKKTGAVTNILAADPDPFSLAKLILEGFTPRETERREISYRCKCSRERVLDAVSGIGRDEIEDIKTKGEPIEVTCKFCDAVYSFSPNEL